MKRKKTIYEICIYAILIIAFLIVIFPLIIVFMASFKTNAEILTSAEKIFPKKWTFENYALAWNSENFRVGQMFFNSIWYSLTSVFILLFLSSVAGYVFARGEFKGKKIIFAIFTALMFVKLGPITIYPQFETLGRIKLSSSLWGLIVMECFSMPIIEVYLVRGFVNSLPKALDDAARIDGCSFTGTFFRIILPLLKPVMITIGMLGFNGSWNNYLYPTLFTMSRPDQQTLIVGIMALKNSGESASAWNLMFAATVIAIVPVLAAFILGNKHITQGMMAGAVKG